MRLKRCRRAAACALLAAWPAFAAPAETEREIAHLLDYIQSSGCTFIRNGEPSDAASARAHVARKYDYLRARVQSAEDFVRLAATQSSISGKPYRVRCGEREMLTGEWLMQELVRHRHRPTR
jgi:hypothetical protein